MASEISQNDRQFWLAYCDSIRTAAGFDAASQQNSAMFFGTTAQRGPPAGDKVHQDFTNAGIFAIADNLPNIDDLFYVPSASNSYIESLLTYVSTITSDYLVTECS